MTFRPCFNNITVGGVTYRLGDVIEYSLEVTGGGQLVIGINGYRFETPTDVEWSATPFYFKAGAYVAVGNGGAGLSDPSTEGGWVVYGALEVLHA
ncbi:polysaccharide lyase family 7 protein [Pseudomonas indica]|uniref:polysaccharide lyase family 7 protein n=1 Tax=Pseudomonas indica TaxID=137658 RepID=UPI0023F89831|nr:polysaccharide lyase family 7 protein [Pseudomonas indica]MBU3055842.1 polysaccharide lyase family 7 protein [Pseudomonas indica]